MNPNLQSNKPTLRNGGYFGPKETPYGAVLSAQEKQMAAVIVHLQVPLFAEMRYCQACIWLDRLQANKVSAILGERRHFVWSARCRRGSGTTCTRSWRWRRPTSPASQCLKTSTGFHHTLYNISNVWLTTLEAGCEIVQPHVLLNLPFLFFFLFYFFIINFFPGRWELQFSQLCFCSTTAVRQTRWGWTSTVTR